MIENFVESHKKQIEQLAIQQNHVCTKKTTEKKNFTILIISHDMSAPFDCFHFRYAIVCDCKCNSKWVKRLNIYYEFHGRLGICYTTIQFAFNFMFALRAHVLDSVLAYCLLQLGV